MAEPLPIPVQDCIAAGTHLNSCDDDGYCNACGYQDSPYDDHAEDPETGS